MQGRRLTQADLELIGDLLRENPDWHRTRLSQELCRCWDWRNAQGQLKDMAARTLLLKLERMAIIRLPAPRQISPNKFRNRALPAPPVGEPINCGLRDLQPLTVSVAFPGTKEANLFNGLLAHYHYLGHRITVGENIRYLVLDCHARPIACLLFGSAAWKCADRDSFIGWERATRERNLPLLTNNTRFLILPWVRVPHLASHVLGLIVRRIRADWQAKYGHTVHALETFVERSRFKGTCYLAANWLKVGATKGRTRNDRDNCVRVPVKDVYLYPLVKNFREELSRLSGRSG
ncbi:MAG: Druantia anti-phage system protein DruA [Smithellaceae bacterium]